MDRNKQYWPSKLANVVSAATAQAGGLPNLSSLREARAWVEFTRRERCTYQPKHDHPLQGVVGQAAMAGGEYLPPEGFSVVSHFLHQRSGAAENAMSRWSTLLSQLDEGPPPRGPTHRT